MGAREDIEDPRFDRLQERIARLEKQAALCPFFQGTKVTNQLIGTGATQLNHMLGRAPVGVIVLKCSLNASIGFSVTQPSDTSKFVNLQASSSTTADLWFF